MTKHTKKQTKTNINDNHVTESWLQQLHFNAL